MVDFSFAAAVVAVVVGLGLAFLGRKIIKLLVFLGAGLAGANIGYALLKNQSTGIALIAALIGFFVLGFLSLAIMKILFGAMLGIAGYFIAIAFDTGQVMAILVGIVLFVLGWFLFKYYLSVATAFAGAVLLFGGLQTMGLPEALALLAALVIGVVGAYYQFKQLKE